MKNRKFEKFFNEEFNKKYNINLKTKDLFQETDFNPKSIINNYWKYSSICSTCLLIISLVFIGYLLTFKLDLGYGESKFQNVNFTEENNILTEEEIIYFRELCDNGFYKDTAKYLELDNDITMYVYKGKIYVDVNGKLKTNYIYFYFFTFNNSNRNIILNVDDNEYVVNKDNRYGILDIIDETKKQEIIFSLSYYGDSDKYLYKGE